MKYRFTKRVSAVVLTVAILFTSVFSMSIIANAATAYSPRLSAPASTNKYYYSDLNVFYKYGYGMPNCTAYAYGRAYEILKTEPKLSWGNAEDWYGYNKAFFKITTTAEFFHSSYYCTRFAVIQIYIKELLKKIFYYKGAVTKTAPQLNLFCVLRQRILLLVRLVVRIILNIVGIFQLVEILVSLVSVAVNLDNADCYI